MSSQNPGGAPRAPRPGDFLQVRIDKMAVGGSGVARHDGFVIFVPDSVSGDFSEIRIEKTRERFAEASLIRVLEPGPGRREPPCHHADECGGCSWQHLTEETQRSEKSRLLLELLEKFLPGEKPIVEPFVESPRALRYRNRVQPQVENGRLGFFRRKSHEIRQISDCLIVEEPLRPFFEKDWTAELGPGRQRVEISVDTDGTPRWKAMNEETEAFGFSQVNRFQNEDLLRTLLDWCKGLEPSEVWDLYAGSGNFTFPLQRRFPFTNVVAVEGSALLVRRGNEVPTPVRPRFHVSDVATFLRRWSPAPESLVVLDPPRAGAGLPVMRALAAASPRRLIYIACHPVSLMRDLAEFLSASRRYGREASLSRLRAFEMFPQTDHFECMACVDIDTH